MIDLTAFIVEQQLECLSQAVYHEARGESRAGQLYVGFVIRNRVLSDKFPDDFCEVIHQPWQFSFVQLIDDKRMYEKEAKERAERVAYTVMNTYPSPIPDDVMYYHTVDITPNWNFNLLDQYKVIGNHVFYGEAE